ncbi:hypothetical protein SLEP1_g8101 [Rubroshorea leprosula]|uniref:TF-B3 domain-containing protein n=1 Tax=Rubroshorea leprosula TaxID=152421 RepID=A0AAV5I0I3_9ROSI|nr:hypothetical protein SLEP1_g8101 [Rubroshorea leprosula]
MSEEDRYWTGFPSNRHQFFKIMIGDFRNQLRIPRKFVRKFKGNLSDTINLRGPSRFVWTVKLARTVDDVFLQNGWEIFARDHSLEENDFLVFRYDENSTFNVVIFDKSACEREASYFVKSAASNGCFVSKKKGRKEPEEVIDLDKILEKDRPKGKVKKGNGNQSSKVSAAINELHQSVEREKTMKQKKLRGDGSETSRVVEIIPSKVDGKRKKRSIKNANEVINLDKVLEYHARKGNLKRRGSQSSRSFGTTIRSHQVKATEKSRKQKKLEGDESETSEEVEILSFKTGGKKKYRTQNENLVSMSENCEMIAERDSEGSKDTVEDWQCSHTKGKPKRDRDEMGIGSSSNQFYPFGSGGKRKQGAPSKNHVPLEPKSKGKKAGIMKRTTSKGKSYAMYFQSNRREVTPEEKIRPYKLAARHLSCRPSFVVVMKPTHVCKYFALTLPREWAAEHIPDGVQRVELRVPPSKEKWPVRLKYNKQKCAFTRGWANFVWDNNLEEHDACVFELAHSRKSNMEGVVFDVIIFRVLDEIVPLTRMVGSPTPSKP